MAGIREFSPRKFGLGEEDSLSAEQERLLVLGAVSGDVDNFGVLYGIYYPRVFRRFYYTYGVRDPMEAENLAQQVFLNAFRKITDYKPQAPFVNWLLSIARNEMNTYLYRGRTESLEIVRDLPSGDRDNPLVQAEISLDMLSLKEAIMTLKPEQLAVFRMRILDEMGHSDIAQAIGKTEIASRSILHKALLSIRLHMGVENDSQQRRFTQGEVREKSTVESRRYTYGDLERVTGIRRGLLNSKVSRAEKAGRITLSVIRGSIRRNFTREDMRIVLSYLGLDHSLLDQIPVATGG